MTITVMTITVMTITVMTAMLPKAPKSTLEDPCGCLRDTDLTSWREPVIKAALAEADVIYADPLYRNLLSAGSPEGTSPKEFHDVPSENYSGRMYRDRIPVFLGPGFKP